MKIKDKIDQTRGDQRVSHAVHSIVLNITCIHLSVRGSYIYMYRRGRIYKEPPGERNKIMERLIHI
jgi:hypothetical protein